MFTVLGGPQPSKRVAEDFEISGDSLLCICIDEHSRTFPIGAESTFRSFIIEFRKLSWKFNLICGYILDEKPQNMTVHFYYLAFFLFCCHWAFFVPTFTLRSKTITKRPLNSLKMIILSLYQAVKTANPFSQLYLKPTDIKN